MSKKPLDTDRMTNELKGKSLFFYPKPPAESAEPEGQSTPPPVPTPDKPQQNPNRTIKPQKQQTANAANQHTGDGFDINAERDQRGTFELTEAEYDAISELKRPLGRQLGVRITLHDIVRCAVNQALADYQANGEDSFLFRHLKYKKA